jgi:hypothetical protein
LHLLHWERLPRLLHLLHHLLRLLLHELLHGLLLLLPVDKLLHRLLLLHELPLLPKLLLPKLLLPKLLLIALLALRAPRHLVVGGATLETGATRTGVLVLAVVVAAPIVATVVVAATATATTTTIAAIVAGVVPPLSLLLCLHELLYLLLQRLHFGEWSCGLKLLLHLRLLLPHLRRTLSDCVHPHGGELLLQLLPERQCRSGQHCVYLCCWLQCQLPLLLRRLVLQRLPELLIRMSSFRLPLRSQRLLATYREHLHLR